MFTEKALNMPHLILRIHPSMAIEGEPQEFNGEFSDSTILSAILELLKSSPKVKELCIQNESPRSGVLFFAGKTELTRLGLLKSSFNEDLEIKIVPILHGGIKIANN